MKQPRGIARVEQSFIAAAWNPELWDAAMEAINNEFAAEGTILLPVQGTVPRLAVTESVRERNAAFYASGWHQHDARRRGIPTLFRDGAMIEHDFTDQAEMARIPFYQDFMYKLKLQWFGGMLLTSGKDRWCVAFQRRLGDDPYDFKDKARLARWGRRLSTASNLAHDLAQAKARLISDLLEAFGKPCILLDRHGDVLRLNARGEALLGQHVSTRNRRLSFSDRDAGQAFSAAASTVLSPYTLSHSAGPVTVRREGRRPLILSLVSLDFIDSSPFAPARVLVLIDDLDERPLATPDQLRRVFGLTGAEASLASLLSEGGDLADAADRLRITNETAKSHLKKIFQKTDTGRQTALLALIARLGGGK